MTSEPVPESWADAVDPELRNQWLMQENKRLTAEVERYKHAARTNLTLSRHWQEQYQGSLRSYDNLKTQSFREAVGRVYRHLQTDFIVLGDLGKHKQAGVQLVLDKIAELAMSQKDV